MVPLLLACSRAASRQRAARALHFTARQLPTLTVLKAAFGCVLGSALLTACSALRSDSHFSVGALHFAGSLFLWRRHLAAGGEDPSNDTG